jgi:hypothetical protein
MTQEDKDLLLKDLCARLPYGVKAYLKQTNCYDSINKVSEKDVYSFRTNKPLEEDHGQHDYYKVIVTDIKPYLFPLSSMTEEQKKEFDQLLELELKAINDEIDHVQATAFEVDFYNKYHLDWRGLIPLGLAIDATGKNIY